jgi:hypothetical protein
MHNGATARESCDARRAVALAADWAPRSSICDAQRARASFANKRNSSAEGWGLGALCLCVEPEFLIELIKIHTNMRYIFLRGLEIIFLYFKKDQHHVSPSLPPSPPSFRLKEPNTLPAPLAPPERLNLSESRALVFLGNIKLERLFCHSYPRKRHLLFWKSCEKKAAQKQVSLLVRVSFRWDLPVGSMDLPVDLYRSA